MVKYGKNQYLPYMNVCFNMLSGEIPSRGLFQNFTSDSFISHKALSGVATFGVPPCQNKPTPILQVELHLSKLLLDQNMIALILQILPLLDRTLQIGNFKFINFLSYYFIILLMLNATYWSMN